MPPRGSDSSLGSGCVSPSWLLRIAAFLSRQGEAFFPLAPANALRVYLHASNISLSENTVRGREQLFEFSKKKEKNGFCQRSFSAFICHRKIESFSRSWSLPLKPNLKMSTQGHSGATPKKVIIPNRHGEKLVGLLHDTGSPDIVVLCHGFRSSKEFKIMVNISAALEKEGISAFRFDFSGNGESEGTFHYNHNQKEADDLHSVVEHFTSEKRRVVAILGHSKGGTMVLLYASMYHDVPNVVNISGRYDMGRGIVERLGDSRREEQSRGRGIPRYRGKLNGPAQHRHEQSLFAD